MFENKKELINNNSQNDSINIKEIIIKLDTIFEERLNQAFYQIMIIPRNKFLNNITSYVKQWIEEQYGNSIYDNTRFNNIFTSCLNNLEDRYNNFTEELTNTWEKYQNSKKMGGEESFFLSNFRKHCIKTEELALHKCQDGKTGNFIIVIKNIKNNSVNKIHKNSQLKHIQYIICNKCKTSYFSNKFINYCKYCNINYLCSIMSFSEDPNLLLATWNPPHCETLANEKIRCLKCNDNFLYLNMKTNMLQCHNRLCNFSTFANSAESICNICNKNFRSNCKIYNPVEVLQIKEAIKITLLIKQKARPNHIPCCGDVDNINTYDFYHKKECKGLLYLGILNNKNIVVCEKCKAINNFSKFFWTCPFCGNKFKEVGHSKSLHDSKNDKLDNKNKKKDDKIYKISNSLNSSSNDIKKIGKENINNNKNDDNNKKEKEENKNINNLNFKNTLYYMMESHKNLNSNNKIDIISDYKTNFHENENSSKSVNEKRSKNGIDIINIDHINNITKKYSHSKYLGNKRDINDIKIIKEELETRYISQKFVSRSRNKDSSNEQINSERNISPVSYKNYIKLNNDSKKNDENNENIEPSLKKRIRLITKRNNFNSQTNNIKGITNQNLFELNKENNNDDKKNIIKKATQDIKTNKAEQNYLKKKNSRYSNSTANINEKDKERYNRRVIELNLNSFSISNNEIIPSTSSKYLFYKSKKNFQSQDNTFNENDQEKLLNQSKHINNTDKENIPLKVSKKNSIPISTKNYKSKKINYYHNQENNKTKNDKESSSNLKLKYLNETEKKMPSFFISPDSYKKEEEKNEYTSSFHLREKYKKRLRSDSKNNSKEDSKKNSTEKKEQNKYIVKNLFKDKNIEKNSILLNNTKELNSENYGITLEQNYGSFHRKKINQRRTEGPPSEFIKKNSYGNNKYYNNRYLYNRSNNNLNTEDYNDLNIKKSAEITSPPPYQNKKPRFEFKRIPKKINTGSPKYNNDTNEDSDKKKRIDLLKEINTEFKPNKFKRKNSIDNDNQNKLSIVEKSDINKTQIIITDNDISKKKSSEKIEKSLKKIISKSKLPNFEIKEFVIRKQIGEGTFGVIYEVYHKKTLTKYAIKKIIAPNLETISEFQKEFELIYENPHKNILVIFGMCIEYMDENNFAIYVLMELAEEDWDSFINKRFNNNLFYTESQLISILKQLTSALCYLQKEKKISHRDIKPENILVFKREVYKISDFGEAKESRLSKQYSTLRGTELYMSPLLYTSFHEEKENVKHNPYKSDVFSLGYCLIYASSLNFNIIYEIRNVSSGTLLKRILTKHLGARYSSKFIDILLKMITFNEDERMDFIELDKVLRDEY